MRILLLGATGRTGKLVLKQALETGYEVNCLSRYSERLQRQEGLTAFEGDPRRKEDLLKAINGCDTVISLLNISRASDFPWARLRTPKTFLSDTMKELVPIASDHGIKRLVVCSAWGVAETKDDLPSWFRWFIDHSNIGPAYTDHERQEKLLEDSSLDWTIVRPVGLTNAKSIQDIGETFKNLPKPKLTISRSSVASYLLESLNRDDLIRKKVVISKK